MASRKRVAEVADEEPEAQRHSEEPSSAKRTRKRDLQCRANISEASRWPAEGPRRDVLQANNLDRALHMVAVRDQDLTDARRKETRLEAAAVNNFFPPGYDRDTEMRDKGFMQVVHEICLRYSDETPPKDVVGIPKNTSREEEAAQRGITVSAVQSLRKQAHDAAVAAVPLQNKRDAKWLYRDLGYPADLVFLFHPNPSLSVDLLKGVLGLPGSEKIRRDVATGICKEIAGTNSENWHSADDVRRMVSIMQEIAPAVPSSQPGLLPSTANGVLRVAKVFMLLGRQKDVCGKKSGTAEIGLLPLWCDYVQSACTGRPWIGAPYAWNPSLLKAGQHAKVYAALKNGEGSSEHVIVPKQTMVASDEEYPEERPCGVQETPTSLVTSLPAVEPNEVDVKRIPWSKKRFLFVQHITKEYPDFTMDETFNEEAWPKLVKGKDSRITGKCCRCGVANGGSIAHIMGKQGLPKCKTAACREPPSEALAQVDNEEGEEGADEQEVTRPKLTHNANFDVVMDFFKTYHPSMQLAAHLRTLQGWEANIVTQSSVIEATCTLCGSVCKCAAQNILFNGQGFCRSCKVLTRGWEEALRIYKHAAAAITNPHMAQEGSGQRYLHVDVECLNAGCGWKGEQSVRYHKMLHKKDPTALISPCKKCNSVVPWKGEGGYHNLLAILEHYSETRFYKMVLDLPQWLHCVINCNSKVPIQCAICDEVREVRLSSIQQGSSVGCGCLRAVLAFEAELKRLLPGIEVKSEVKIKDTSGTFDFAVFVGTPEDNSRSYLDICGCLGLNPAPTTPRIVFEHDGRQHFDLSIYGEKNVEIGKRDLFKDLYACKEGITVIRVQQTSVWKDDSPWKEFLKSAIAYALVNPGGRIICEDAPNYVDAGEYVRFRAGTALSEVTRSACLQHGVLREFHPEKVDK